MLRAFCRRGLVRPYSSSNVKNPLGVAFSRDDSDEDAMRYRRQKNPEIPSVANLSTRWAQLDAGKQDDVIAYLEDKMRGPWHEMTADEKKAAHYVWYGAWGPRASQARDMANIYSGLAMVIGLTCLGLATYKFATFSADDEIAGIDYNAEKSEKSS